MKFSQVITFKTSRIEEFNAKLDDWKTKTEGRRIPHRASLQRDRDNDGVYLLVVEFDSYEIGMENSSRPETADFASFLNDLSEGPLEFRNLDVLRDEQF